MRMEILEKIKGMERWELALFAVVAALIILVAVNFLIIGSGPHYIPNSGGITGTSGDPASGAAGSGGYYSHT